MPRLSAFDRNRMFRDLSAKPLEVWMSPAASASPVCSSSSVGRGENQREHLSAAVKNVQRLFDYELVESDNHGGQQMIELNPIAPALDSELLGVEGKQLTRLKDSAYEEHASMAMETPIAVLAWLGELDPRSVDVVCTRTLPTALYRFCLNEERFYRFDVERIGKVVFVQEADMGDARPGPSYLLSLLESVTSRPSRGYRQVITYEFGGLKLLVRLHVDLAEIESDQHPQVLGLSPTPIGRSILGERQSTEEDDAVLEALKRFMPSALPLTEYMALSVAPSFQLPNSSVSLRGGYGQPKRVDCVPIEVMTRGAAQLTETSLSSKWPNLHFSGAERILVGVHERGEVKQCPEIILADDIAPADREEILVQAASLLNEIVAFVRSLPIADGNHFALIWINDALGDGDNLLRKENITLYRRFPKQTNLFLSDSLKRALL